MVDIDLSRYRPYTDGKTTRIRETSWKLAAFAVHFEAAPTIHKRQPLLATNTICHKIKMAKGTTESASSR